MTLEIVSLGRQGLQLSRHKILHAINKFLMITLIEHFLNAYPKVFSFCHLGLRSLFENAFCYRMGKQDLKYDAMLVCSDMCCVEQVN